jgi:hypothetical protein
VAEAGDRGQPLFGRHDRRAPLPRVSGPRATLAVPISGTKLRNYLLKAEYRRKLSQWPSIEPAIPGAPPSTRRRRFWLAGKLVLPPGRRYAVGTREQTRQRSWAAARGLRVWRKGVKQGLLSPRGVRILHLTY